MLCPPRSGGGGLLTGTRPWGVCLHGRRLSYCGACGGKGWCQEHGCRRSTCGCGGRRFAVTDTCHVPVVHASHVSQCAPREDAPSRQQGLCAPVVLPPTCCPDPVSSAASSAARGRCARRVPRAPVSCMDGSAVRTRAQLRCLGVFQCTRARLRLRGGARLLGVALKEARGAVRKNPARTSRLVARLGVRGCSNPLCPCDVDAEGYECRPLCMMTKGVFVWLTKRGAKRAEWRRLSGRCACACACAGCVRDCARDSDRALTALLGG